MTACEVRLTTSSNLLESRMIGPWQSTMDGDGITTAYTDFAKAFASVSRQKLLYKLQNYCISGNLFTRIKNFLSESLPVTDITPTTKPLYDKTPYDETLPATKLRH